MSRLTIVKCCGGFIMLVCLCSCSPLQEKELIPWGRTSHWVTIGVYSSVEAEGGIANILEANGIPYELGDGSIMYGVVVPGKHAKQASELLLADSEARGYRYLPYEEFARRTSDQFIASTIIASLDKDMASGEYSRAIGVLERTIELIPSVPGLYGKCLDAYLLKGDVEKARSLLEKAKSKIPSHWFVWEEVETRVAEAEKDRLR